MVQHSCRRVFPVLTAVIMIVWLRYVLWLILSNLKYIKQKTQKENRIIGTIKKMEKPKKRQQKNKDTSEYFYSKD